MCGADNSGACQIACTGSQGSIGDPTNKCTGFGSGGTVCCSPADQSQYEWPSGQCTALGGRNAIGSCDDIANTFDGGAFLTLDCNPSGRCCLPSGVFNASNPLPKPQACVAANCTDTPGGACRVSCNGGETPSGAGVCRGADAGKTCCIPGGGGICQTKGGVCVSGSCASDNRESNSAGGSCVGADAGKTCCSATQNTSSAPVGALNYTLLEEIPGSTTGVTGNLATYLQNLYKFTFWAIGVAALFMLTVGGFMYVTSAGNTSRVETAKTIITDSLLGIIVALFAWLFLYVINPDLVEGLQLPNTAPTGGTTPAPGTSPGATGGTLSHATAVAALGGSITLSSSGSCSDQQNPSCTSLEGVPTKTVDWIKNLRDKSGCSLIITGGTEVGHKTHGPGLGSIDFGESNCLGTFLQNNITKHNELGIQRICATTTWFSKVGASCTESAGAPHFHIQFST